MIKDNENKRNNILHSVVFLLVSYSTKIWKYTHNKICPKKIHWSAQTSGWWLTSPESLLLVIDDRTRVSCCDGHRHLCSYRPLTQVIRICVGQVGFALLVQMSSRYLYLLVAEKNKMLIWIARVFSTTLGWRHFCAVYTLRIEPHSPIWQTAKLPRSNLTCPDSQHILNSIHTMLNFSQWDCMYHNGLWVTKKTWSPLKKNIREGSIFILFSYIFKWWN